MKKTAKILIVLILLSFMGCKLHLHFSPSVNYKKTVTDSTKVDKKVEKKK